MIGGMFILFLVLLLLNVPIAFSLGASSLFYLLTSNMNAAVLAQKFYAGIDSFTLLCIPGFMLAGALMNGGGIPRRILNFCNAFLGHFTGSLALVNIVASMVFAGISGTVQSRGGKLTFDSTALAFGLLADGKVSPATAPYVVAESWRTGYITSVGQEENGLRLTVDTSLEENPLTVDTWLDREKGIPIFAEVCYNGQRILTISISEFQYNT